MHYIRLVSLILFAALLSPFSGQTGFAAITQAAAAPRASEASRAAALISRYRAEHGLGPVKVDTRLNAAAAHQARAVAQLRWLSHGDFAGRMSSYGIRGTAAENLGIGVNTVEAAIAQWQGSSPHKANLLMPAFRRIGLARSENYWALVLAQ